jgi:hypothetical protein
MKFRLRKDVGSHFEPNPNYDPDQMSTDDNPRDNEYKGGDIVESTRPLDQIFVNKFDPIMTRGDALPNAAGGDVPATDPDKDPNKDRPVRDYEDANVNRAGRFLTEEELEGKPELQKLSKGQAVEVSEDEEDEGSSEGPGEDVTDAFSGASENSLKVYQDEEGTYRVYSKDDTETPIKGSKKGFDTKKEVKAFLKDQMK